MLYPFVILAMDNPEDRAFMERLYDDYGGIMYAVACQTLGTERQSADDVVSDAIIALIKKIALLRTFECYVLRAYVVSTIRNTALTYLRKSSRFSKRHVLDDGTMLDGLADDDSDVDVDMIRRGEIERIKRAVSQLDERDRRVLEMKYVDELTNAEIARELGISVDSVRPRLMRVRRRAYAILKEAMRDE